MANKPTTQDIYDTARWHLAQGRTAESVPWFQRCINLDPTFHTAWADRGAALHLLGNHFDSVLNYEKAIELAPNEPNYWNNRGVALMEMERFGDALTSYAKAISLNPSMPEAHMNMGNIYRLTCKSDFSIPCYREALRLNPNYTDAHLNMSFSLLELGQFEEGWAEYEWRWKSGQIFPRNCKRPDGQFVPLWDGEPLDGKTLMIHAEQGHGDTLQFIRYAKTIKERWPTCTIVAEVRHLLTRLIQNTPGVDRAVSLGEDFGELDYVVPVVSLPRIMKQDINNIPTDTYLFASPELVKFWGEYLDDQLKHFKGRKRVGICWAGGARPLQPAANAIDRRRSTHIRQWAPLNEVDGIIYVSLQVGDNSIVQQLRELPKNMTIAEFSGDISDFADTVAICKNLDLVICVDTAITHASAGAGVPTWMVSRFDGCWRWLGDRPDSPWYPTLTQFRQPSNGDWDSVFVKVAEALKVYWPLEMAAE